MKLVDRAAIAVSMALGIGLAPFMPGTFGSLPGLALAWGLGTWGAAFPAVEGYALITLVLIAVTALAWWSIARTEAVLHIHDDQRIVVDEVAGQAIAAAFLPLDWRWYLAAFVLFRLLDMTKPGPIGKIDRDVHGAAGTLCDDLLAGVVAAVVLVLAHAAI